LPFPRAISYVAFRAVLPELPAEMLYDPEVLVWRVMKQLPLLLASLDLKGCKTTFRRERQPQALPAGGTDCLPV